MNVFVTINGQRRQLHPGATVASIVESLPGAPDGRGVAVAVQGEVIPRTAWSTTELTDGMRVEVVAAVQGG
jgi:sulfur carrier protein